MNAVVLCHCGHHAQHHTEAGCSGGRYRPCPCPLRPSAIGAAAPAAAAPT